VVRNGDRVVGIRGRARGGTAVQDRAAVVIGADGKHSAVAKAVGVPNYLEKPSLTAGYYTYWSGLGITDFRVYVRPKRAIVAVPTHDDLTLVLVGWPHAEFAANKPDIEGTYHRAVAQIPDLAERLRGGRREARFVGTGDMPNAFRTPYGPGWALVGDAGYVRDPCTAQGISDSFRDAEQITAALAEFYAGRLRFGTAMGRFHAERDAAVKPMFDFTLQLAAMEPLPAFIRGLFRSMQGSPARTEKFLGVIAGTVSPKEFFAPANLVGTFAGGLARTVPRPTFPRGAGTARQQA
jgi:2-polyprenyl-6-methoxyphenol hydroxylase-like FAD-dependent oxidoreductase